MKPSQIQTFNLSTHQQLVKFKITETPPPKSFPSLIQLQTMVVSWFVGILNHKILDSQTKSSIYNITKATKVGNPVYTVVNRLSTVPTDYLLYMHLSNCTWDALTMMTP